MVSPTPQPSRRLSLGQVLATPGALRAVTSVEIAVALARHASGDWGNVDAHDKRANDEALRAGTRVLSAYETELGQAFWVITEADRSSTTILLPCEY